MSKKTIRVFWGLPSYAGYVKNNSQKWNLDSELESCLQATYFIGSSILPQASQIITLDMLVMHIYAGYMQDMWIYAGYMDICIYMQDMWRIILKHGILTPSWGLVCRLPPSSIIPLGPK